MTPDGPVFGLVLAGGRGERMGDGPTKPLRLLAGRPLVRHVLDRLAPHVHQVLISAMPSPAWSWSEYEIVPDAGAAFGGPGVGIVTTLHHLRERLGSRPFRMITAPADAPFLPPDLVSRLLSAGPRTAVACFAGGPVPTCAVWRSTDLADVAEANGRSIRSLLASCDPVDVPFPASRNAPGGDPFFNVNTPSDLDRAERSLRGR